MEMFLGIFAVVAIPVLFGYVQSFRERNYLYSYETYTTAYEAECRRMRLLER